MPYIKKRDREELAEGRVPFNTGELTYVLFQEAVNFKAAHVDNFEMRAGIMAAFECAKMEFYRRYVAPYEDTKIAENGDVFPKEEGDDNGK